LFCVREKARDRGFTHRERETERQRDNRDTYIHIHTFGRTGRDGDDCGEGRGGGGLLGGGESGGAV